MSIFDRLRPAKDEPEVGSAVIGARLGALPPTNDLIGVDPMRVEIQEPEQRLLARAMIPYRRLSKARQAEYIDSRILIMMQAAEAMMNRTGDVWEANIAALELGSGDLIVQHKDPGVARAYRDFFQRIHIRYLLEDAWLTRATYGNAYLLVMGKGARMAVTSLNPKHVAVGRQVTTGPRPIAFFPGSRNAEDLNAEFSQMAVLSPDWNEWKDHGDIQVATPLDPRRVIHSYDRKFHHWRYAQPPLMRAWDDLTTRLVLAELVRSTAEALKTQIRLWTIENPMRGEITKLVNELRNLRSARAYDLVWRAGLKHESVVPTTIDALLANETWMRYTMSIFRDLGMFLRLVSGEAPSSVGSDRGVEIEVQIALSRLAGEQELSRRIVSRIARLYATYGDPALAGLDPPAFRFGETVLSTSQLVRNKLVPLMNYGAISLRSVHEDVGLDHEAEIARLEQERSLRDDGLIRPYTGFAQAGPRGMVQHPQSQGRPPGADLNPENVQQNRENARNGRG